jgi:hypothetical protein
MTLRIGQKRLFNDDTRGGLAGLDTAPGAVIN